MNIKALRVFSLLLAVIAAVSMVGTAVMATDSGETAALESRYDKPDANVLTDLGQDPEELAVSSKSEFFNKEWYEYISYSDMPVSSIRIDDNRRLVFYDPYSYVDSMVMDWEYDQDIGWSTANSVEISHEFSKSMSMDESKTTETASDREHAEGGDMTGEFSTSSSHSSSSETHEDFSVGGSISAGTEVTTSVETMVGASVETAVEAGVASASASASTEVTVGASASVSANVETSTEYSNGISESISDETSASATVGWSTVADRVTTSTGSSSSTTTSWSSSETTSITRTFEAMYFNDNGTPYQWTIAHMEVKMPLKTVLQQKIGGVWVTVDTDYVLLTTLRCTCRAWIQNGTTFLEHWATGEPVADNAFFSSFFTEEQLLAAYQNKLYPD